MICFAICGFGFMGTTHARCLAGRADARLCAIVESDPSRFESSGTGGNLSMAAPEVRLDGVRLHTELEAVLRMPDIDVIDICLPVRFHHDWAQRALRAGKHVLLEKPMVLDPAQGRELIALAHETNRILMVAHVVRFMPAYQTLVATAKDGHYGPLELLILQRWAGEPGWGMWKDAEGRRTSGGGLFDLLIHDIDLANSLLGKPSRIDSHVFAGGISNHDVVSAAWHYDTGAAALLEGGFAFHTRVPFASRFLARFTNATLVFDSSQPGVVNIAKEDALVPLKVDEDPLGGFMREIDYFIQCVNANHWPEECSPESSLEAVELALDHVPARRRNNE